MIGVIIFLSIIGLSFLFTGGLVYIVCWAFSLTFSWKIVFGIWALLALARTVFKQN